MPLQQRKDESANILPSQSPPSQISPSSSIQQNVVSLESVNSLMNEYATRSANETSKIANEVASRAAAEAATQAVAIYKKSEIKPLGDDVDVNLDKEMRRAFYKKMTTPSFGDTLAQQIDGSLAQQITAKLIPNLFGGGDGGSSVKKEGFVGALYDFLNTQFAYGAGQTMGNQLPELIKSLGQDKIGKLIDTYTQKNGGQPGQQEQSLSPEEQQKRTENTIMQLDSTVTEHVTNFMQATGIKDYATAQKAILTEQRRILQSRGLLEDSPIHEELRPEPKSEPKHSEPRKAETKDLNRQLMDQYENPNSNSNASINNNDKGNDFFGNPGSQDLFISQANQLNQPSVPFLTGPQVNNHDFIMSLNPDDPVSQQQFMVTRGVSGVPIDIVKRMMIKEQKGLRDNNGINNTPEVTKTPVEVVPQDINQVNSITSILEKMDKNFEISMKLVTEKISVLEKEIVVLKSGKNIIKESEIIEEPNNEESEIIEEPNNEESFNGLSEDDPANIEKYNINNEKVNNLDVEESKIDVGTVEKISKFKIKNK